MPKRRSQTDRPRRNVHFTNTGYSVDPLEILESKSAQRILRRVREKFPAVPSSPSVSRPEPSTGGAYARRGTSEPLG